MAAFTDKQSHASAPRPDKLGGTPEPIAVRSAAAELPEPATVGGGNDAVAVRGQGEAVDDPGRQPGSQAGPRGGPAHVGDEHADIRCQYEVSVRDHQVVAGDVRQVPGNVGPGGAAVTGFEDV